MIYGHTKRPLGVTQVASRGQCLAGSSPAVCSSPQEGA
jgi:hypothetical protein